MLKKSMRLLMILLAFFTQVAISKTFLHDYKIPIPVAKIKVIHNIPSKEAPKIQILKQSLQWKRLKGVLPMPSIKIAVIINQPAKEYGLRYKEQTYLFHQGKIKARSIFFYSLFEAAPISFYHHDKKIGEIYLELPLAGNSSPKHLIDHTCFRYQLEVNKLKNKYLSLGCQLTRTGKLGKEKGNLEIYWSSPNLILPNGATPPFKNYLDNTLPIQTFLTHKYTQKKEEISIKAKVPKKIHRLNTALGFGPYLFQSFYEDNYTKEEVTIPIMLYANLYLTPETSIRAFEAFAWNESYFNNFGIYFAYDMASVEENLLKIIPLLGFQGIKMHHQPTQKSLDKYIFPQGFELIYKHPFGKKNYTLAGGLFLSPTANEDYKNLWIRYGKKVFWEINFLSYRYGPHYTKTWGLSVGIPFLSFF